MRVIKQHVNCLSGHEMMVVDGLVNRHEEDRQTQAEKNTRINEQLKVRLHCLRSLSHQLTIWKAICCSMLNFDKIKQKLGSCIRLENRVLHDKLEPPLERNP